MLLHDKFDEILYENAVVMYGKTFYSITGFDNILSVVLLSDGCTEKKAYPHNLTLIRTPDDVYSHLNCRGSHE